MFPTYHTDLVVRIINFGFYVILWAMRVILSKMNMDDICEDVLACLA